MAEDRVVVVGAGPAGIRATEVLAHAKLQPILIDEAPAAGGRIYQQPPDGFRRGYRDLYGFEARKAWRLHETLNDIRENIDYRPNTLAWNVRDAVLDVTCNGVHDRIPFDALILALGAVDLALPFPGWTKPGVFTVGGAQVALQHQGCAIGRRTVFIGTGPLLYLVAFQYVRAGAEVAAVLDTSPSVLRWQQALGLLSGGMTFAKGVSYVAWLKWRGIPVLDAVRPISVEGDDCVEALLCRGANGQEFRVPADAVAMGFGLQPECQLADLAHCDFFYEVSLRQWLPVIDEDGQSSVESVYIAGDGRRIAGADAAEARGALAALAVLVDLGYPVTHGTHVFWRTRSGNQAQFRRALERAFPAPVDLAQVAEDDTIVCRCEAITAGEIRSAARELGASEINRVKTLTRVGMGPCQGRYCAVAATEVLAAALEIAPDAAGRLRGQAPVKPLGTAEAEDG